MSVDIGDSVGSLLEAVEINQNQGAAKPPLYCIILKAPSMRNSIESPMSTEVCRTYCKGGALKTCTESPMSTEVWEDYCKLKDLKRPPVPLPLLLLSRVGDRPTATILHAQFYFVNFCLGF